MIYLAYYIGLFAGLSIGYFGPKMYMEYKNEKEKEVIKDKIRRHES